MLSSGAAPTHDLAVAEVIDTHCHLDLPVFDADRAEVLARARDVGVSAILIPAIRPRTFAALAALRDRHRDPAIAIAIGTHPQVVPDLEPAERQQALDAEAIANAARAAGAVAIGECGLDGGTAEPELQEQILRAHIRAAHLSRLPLVVHVLRAHHAAPRILAEERAGEVGAVLHSYSGGVDLVPVYAGLDMHFSFAGPVTYARARRPLEAARAVAGDRLLVETDAPDQTPEPHRGRRCEPAFVTQVVEALAAARQVPAPDLAAQTTANARRLFRFPP
jgi:TatD DNase family protein